MRVLVEAEVRELRDEYGQTHISFVDERVVAVCNEVLAQREVVAAEEKALRRYGHHHRDCPFGGPRPKGAVDG